MTYTELKRRCQENPDFGVIKIRYSPASFDNMIEKVKRSVIYSVEEKNTLFRMLEQMKREDWLLYMAEIYNEKQFDFQIENFEHHKKNLVAEVYNELIAQLLNKYADYEEIWYSDIKEWFYGLTINIELLTILDRHFSEMGVKIQY